MTEVKINEIGRFTLDMKARYSKKINAMKLLSTLIDLIIGKH